MSVHNLKTLLRSVCTQTTGETVSVRDLLNAVGRRAYGPVLSLLGLVAISPLTLLPGANSLVAIIILLLSLQMAFGQPAPWLPPRLVEVTFPRELMIQAVEKAEPYVDRVDRIMRPRLVFLTRPPFLQGLALLSALAALVTIPLSIIPHGPVIPSLAVLLLGLAITARDGLVVVLGLASLCAATYLLIQVWDALPFF